MGRLQRLMRRLTGRDDLDREMTDELRHHLEQRTDDLAASGLPRDEAARRARVEFGSLESYKEQCREERAWVRARRLPEALWRDLAFAMRRLGASPGFALFSIVTLALGIGVTTAVYSVLYATMWRPIGIRDGARVVVIAKSTAMRKIATNLSWPDYQDFLSQQKSFHTVAGWTVFGTALVANGRAELIAAAGVTGEYFSTIGVEPVKGRLIHPGDDRPDAPKVVVISDAAWRNDLDADPDVIGTSVKIGDQAFEVVGIVPRSFRGLDPFGDRGLAAWIPIAHARPLLFPYAQGRQRPDFASRNLAWVRLVARLPAGRSLTEATSEATLIGERLDASAPLYYPANMGMTEAERKAGRTWIAAPAIEEFGLTDERDAALAVLALPALVLLVACTNLGNLVLSRGVTRRHEFAVRRALGASRWRLIREQLVEQAVIVTIGGTAGILVTQGLLAYGVATAQDTFGYAPQYQIDLRLEPAVLAAVGACVLLSILVSGLVPAWQLTRGGVRHALASDAGGAILPRWRGRGNLIALQVGVSVALLLIAAFCVRQIMALPRDKATAAQRQVALVSIPFFLQHQDEARARRTIETVIDDVRRTPGVAGAAASSDRRFSSWRLGVTSDDRPFTASWSPITGQVPEFVAATPGLFDTIGAPIRYGRGFDARDAPGAPRVIVLSESVARALFRQTDVTGRQVIAAPVVSRGTSSVVDESKIETFTIVGVAADTFASRGRAEEVAYVPFAQRYSPEVSIFARASGPDATPLVGLLRGAVRRADPELAVSLAGRADAVMGGPNLALGLLARATVFLAVLALVLSMAGLYGVLSHVVARRMREMGVRMALGADARRILLLVIKDGVRPVAEGLFIGLGVAAGVRLGMQPLFEKPITAVDPVAFVIALVPLLAAASIACYVPARRAARVDPNVALREL